MITKHFYSSDNYRPMYDGKIIDIGGANSAWHGHLDAIIEIRQPQAAANYVFLGNMDFPELWDEVHNHVEKHGKWDYAVTTHTLEDLLNPLFATTNIEKIAHRGLIVVPSKYREFARFSGNFRGFMHHHFIFDVIDGVLTAFPKIGYIEEKIFDNIPQKLNTREELVVEWEGEIGMKYVFDGMPFNGDEHLKECYRQLLND